MLVDSLCCKIGSYCCLYHTARTLRVCYILPGPEFAQPDWVFAKFGVLHEVDKHCLIW